MEDQILIKKLEEFIHKYYKNQLIRGIILTLILLIGVYSLLVVLEYYLHFNTTIRTMAFLAYIALVLITTSFLILIPGLKMYKIGKVLSYEQAAVIIGEHFKDIQDKLLNTIQLIQKKKARPEQLELIVAGIEQKTKFIKVFNFRKIIQIRKNFKFLKFIIPVIILLLFLGIFFPDIISGPTRRLVLFNSEFAIPLPFQLKIENENFRVMQQEDFELKVSLRGKEIPKELFVNSNGINYKMKKESPFIFTYIFKSLQTDIRFFVQAGRFKTNECSIIVYPKPTIIHFEFTFDYPEYLKMIPEHVENSSEIVIPEGTTVNWNIFTKDVDEVVLKFEENVVRCKKELKENFKYSKSFTESTSYIILPGNKYTYKADSLPCRVSVIKDAFPSISLIQDRDSSFSSRIFFKGVIKDDYGFSKLNFNYAISDGDNNLERKMQSESLWINTETTSQSFLFDFSLNEIEVKPGESIRCYFEVWDNDGIHGPKSTKSETLIFSMLTIEEIAETTEKSSKKVEENLEKNVKESKAIKKKIEVLQRKRVEKEVVNWQEKKTAEELIKSFEKLSDEIERISKENLQNIQKEQDYFKTSERILNKQKELNNMMKDLLTDEMKREILEMKKLLEQADKTKMNELLEKMKISNKEIEEQLDRTLDLYKKIEFERKMEQVIKDIRELAKTLEDQAAETNKAESSKEKRLLEQQKIRGKFDSVKNVLNGLEKESKEMEGVANIEKTNEEQKKISKNLEQTEKLLDSKNIVSAQKLQKESAEKMNNLAEKLENMQNEAEEEENAENAESLRKILDDLVNLSFDQEELIYEIRNIGRGDPRFQGLIVRQDEMSSKVKNVEDSLNELSRRELALKPIVAKEVTSINANIRKSVDMLNERNISGANVSQQYTMTSMNNLAMLLSEALSQMNMDMQMNSQNKSGKACKKPSGKPGKKTAKSMKELQSQISQQMKKIKEGIEKNKKAGKQNTSANSELNKQIATLAAQQESLRREMQHYQENSDQSTLQEKENMNSIIKEMNENERDLIFSRISQETLNRQQRILSRLLEAEKADEKRDFEEKRQAEQPKISIFSNQNEKIKYNYKNEKENEILKMSPLPLKVFYKNKISSYLIKMQ